MYRGVRGGRLGNQQSNQHTINTTSTIYRGPTACCLWVRRTIFLRVLRASVFCFCIVVFFQRVMPTASSSSWGHLLFYRGIFPSFGGVRRGRSGNQQSNQHTINTTSTIYSGSTACCLWVTEHCFLCASVLYF